MEQRVYSFRDPCTADHVVDELTYRLDLGRHLEQYRDTSQQTNGNLVERDTEGVVPRADDPHHSDGFVILGGSLVDDQLARLADSPRSLKR